MLNYEMLKQAALEAGFTAAAPLRVETVELLEDVRNMCQANSCGQYGKNWSCPPGCGTLDECRDRVGTFREGLLVQTVAQLEDDLDGEGMLRAEAQHKKTFAAFHTQLLAQYPLMLALGTGCCTRCAVCTYPDAPCRFPEKKLSSMEAYGMLVLRVCKANDLPYYYGPGTIAYTGCYLLV